MLAEYLAAEGFAVATAADGEEGQTKARAESFDLVVLDVMLPRMDGFTVLRHLRAQSSVPVLMLSARGQHTDRIQGLEFGADDYLPKPFDPRELLARVQAILRRASPGVAATFRVGDLEVNRGARTARRGGEPVVLTALEFDLLCQLAARRGEVISREELYRAVLGRDFEVYDRSLDNHVSSLRKKLGPAADGGPRIRAVRNAGYVYSAT